MTRTQPRGPGWESLIHQANELDALPLRAAKLVPIGWVTPMADQPRQTRDPAAQRDLEASIRSRGIEVPLLVWRPNPARSPNRYEVIAGHNRLDAALAVGLEQVPVLVKDLPDADAAYDLALLENLQHSQLDPVDAGWAFARLHERGLSYREMSEVTGLNKDFIRRRLLLVARPGAIDAYRAGTLTLDDLVDAPPPIAAAPPRDEAAFDPDAPLPGAPRPPRRRRPPPSYAEEAQRLATGLGTLQPAALPAADRAALTTALHTLQRQVRTLLAALGE